MDNAIIRIESLENEVVSLKNIIYVLQEQLNKLVRNDNIIATPTYIFILHDELLDYICRYLSFRDTAKFFLLTCKYLSLHIPLETKRILSIMARLRNVNKSIRKIKYFISPTNNRKTSSKSIRFTGNLITCCQYDEIIHKYRRYHTFTYKGENREFISFYNQNMSTTHKFNYNNGNKITIVYAPMFQFHIPSFVNNGFKHFAPMILALCAKYDMGKVLHF